MALIEKPPTTAIAEGFDELNSKCNAMQFTTILCACGPRKPSSQPFVIFPQAGAYALSGALAQSFPPKAERGNDEY